MAVEFALVVPVLLMLVFGMLHFGLILAQKASLNSAVRSGARYGSVNLYNSSVDPHTCTKVIARSKEGVGTLGMSANAISYSVYRGPDLSSATSGAPLCTGSAPSSTPPCQGSSQSDNLYVVATFTSDLIGIPFTGVSKSVALKSVGVYRCEYS